MKLLLDENVSNKIREGLVKLEIKGTIHINSIGKGITDEKVFEIAKREERVIVTGDDDFKANKFKYKIPIIWITPKARRNNDIPILIKWILDNISNYNIDIKRAFITIRTEEYFIEYKHKEGILGKTKNKVISFNKIKELVTDKR